MARFRAPENDKKSWILLKINNDKRGKTHPNGPFVNRASPIARPASHFKDVVLELK